VTSNNSVTFKVTENIFKTWTNPNSYIMSQKSWLNWPKRPKIVCSPSYADIKSRANTTRGLDFDHMIKREHTREI
jgi:hypothetical protein